MRSLFRMMCVFLLTGCGGSIYVNQPPPSLTQPCADPARLPERGMTDQEIEVMWGRDRTALRLCGSQLDGLAKWAIVQTDKG